MTRILSILLVASVCLGACRNRSHTNTGLVNKWALKSLSDTTFTIPDGKIFLMLDADGTASGDGGCNGYSGTYVVNGTQLSFHDLISTLLWCDYGNLETKFMKALQETNNYAVGNGTLSLYHDATLRATFTTMP